MEGAVGDHFLEHGKGAVEVTIYVLEGNVSALLMTWTSETRSPDRIVYGRFVYINSCRNITKDWIENNDFALCDEISVAPREYLGKDWFLQSSRLMQYRLSDGTAVKTRCNCFPKMQKENVSLLERFDSATSFPGRQAFHTTSDQPCALGGQSDSNERTLTFPIQGNPR